jgi:hypothetical protein
MNKKPFHVYYRHTRGKGYKEFATRAAQLSFIRKAPLSWAITSYN